MQREKSEGPSAPIRKERLSLTRKARREASRNKFVENDGMPDRVESCGEVDRTKNLPRARSWFINPSEMN